jgi:hypothetical protein
MQFLRIGNEKIKQSFKIDSKEFLLLKINSKGFFN